MKIGITIILIMFTSLLLISFRNLPAQIPQWENQLKTDPTNTELLMKLGKAYHDLAGEKEDKEAAQKAEQHLSKLLEIEPDNALAMVYYGSALTMKARDTFLPWNIMKFMKQGFATMDSAVALDPDEPEARLIRAINGTSLPKMFKRLNIALADFKFIEAIDKEKLAEMTNKFWLPYYYYFGLALAKAEQFEEAKVKFAKVIALDSDAEYAKKASQQLEKMKN